MGLFSPRSKKTSSVDTDSRRGVSVSSQAPSDKIPVTKEEEVSFSTFSSPRLTPLSSQSSVPKSKAPRCRKCNRECIRRITKTSNRNGNPGRPYYKCDDCDVFACFDDERGDDAGNPLCDCDLPSKRQISSAQKGRKIFYSCRTGACDFYKAHQKNGKDFSVNEDVADALRELNFA